MTDTHTLAARGVALVLTATGTAKVLALSPMTERARHLGFSGRAFRAVGVCELAGVTGLLLGRRHPRVGAAAAVAVCSLMGGACWAHRRVGDSWTATAPAVVVGVGAAHSAKRALELAGTR
ncbi:DoxX family protein [Dietzia sp. SLG310A2-38A2]|uniref:DoxX family protein n=1 Tax=Dietzia sp. SLG310A2-38A2 TaxID=1630643 RepID=UPI0015F97AD1|nr:DoxX family protein [Dietzia sp. SLG310A2-38A2]MBB1031292.1 DoxX family protein [Dietzia sp. SLG310A2-38A2]